MAEGYLYNEEIVAVGAGKVNNGQKEEDRTPPNNVQ